MGGLRAVVATTRRAAGRRYATASAYHRVALAADRRRRREPPVLVYQMGKVGSETVAGSLEAAGLMGRVYHVHFLSDAGVRWATDVYRARWQPGVSATHLWESLHLRRRLHEATPESPWKVVTLMRDPVARNLSSFFQVGDLQFGLDWDELLPRRDEPGIVDELTARFLDEFDEHDRPLRWFDDELAPVFGVDVLDAPSPASSGWARHRAGRADLLILKLEGLQDVGPRALGDLVGAPEVPLVDRNVAEGKAYGELYRRFVAEAVLPAPYLDRMYDHPVTQHFYTPSELDAFRRRWLRQAGPAPGC